MFKTLRRHSRDKCEISLNINRLNVPEIPARVHCMHLAGMTMWRVLSVLSHNSVFAKLSMVVRASKGLSFGFIINMI
ncbi:MAG: hypothetical protein AAF228_02145 [Pseudomonadota bacterium]